MPKPPSLKQSVGNQQKWNKKRAEKSGGGLRYGKLPEDHVVLSSPFDTVAVVAQQLNSIVRTTQSQAHLSSGLGLLPPAQL